jgi:hypothetical protein
MTTVTASTSLILVTTSNGNGPYTVKFPNISTTGRIITVRDNDGFASTNNAIVLEAISGATFQGVSGSLTINQPFGFITLNSQANGIYGVLNTFAFPAGSATASVSNITTTNLATQSTIQIRDRTTGAYNTLYTSSGQLILNNSPVGQVSAADLTSTVAGLGTAGYLSTAPLFVSTQFISSLQTNFLSAGAMSVGSFNPALINTNLVITNVLSTPLVITNVLSAGLTNISSLRTNARIIVLGSNAAAVGVQGIDSVAIGTSAGNNTQSQNSVAIGTSAGATLQGTNSVAVGFQTGLFQQGSSAVAIGGSAGELNQGTYSIALGESAGKTSQGTGGIAIGFTAGFSSQVQYATAIGYEAGYQTQSEAAIALGVYAGKNTQGQGAIAVGLIAGSNIQGQNATAIGREAGSRNQGTNAVAIGAFAGSNNQSTNTIVLNATGVSLNTTALNATYIKPIRQNLILNSNMGALYYISTTGELTYGPTLISTFSTIRTSSLGLGTNASQFTLDVNGTGNFSNTSSGVTSHRAYIGILGVSQIPEKNAPFTQFTDGLTSAMPFEPLSYGTVQITRPANPFDSRFYLSFIRQANFIVGMGFLSNTNTWGIQSGGTSNTNGFFGNFATTNFGINNSTPSYSLDVSSNFRVSSNAENFMTTSFGGGLCAMELKGSSGAYMDIGRSNVDYDFRMIYQGGNTHAEITTAGTVTAIALMPASGTGRVGINTTSPAHTLDVNGELRVNNNNIYITGSTGNSGRITPSGTGGGVRISGPLGTGKIYIDNTTCSIEASSGTTITGNLNVIGTVSKAGGSFEIDHPVLKNSTLVHSFIEGPRCDLIYRGKKQLSSGIAIIDLEKESTGNGTSMAPGTFVALCTNPQTYLQNNETFDRVIGSVSANILTIRSENLESKAIIDWMVIAERHDPFIKTWDRTDSNGLLILEHAKRIVQ